MPESEILIAVVGAGQIGKRHAELIVNSDACRLAAIVDPAPAAADYAGTLGVPHHASLAELLARSTSVAPGAETISVSTTAGLAATGVTFTSTSA